MAALLACSLIAIAIPFATSGSASSSIGAPEAFSESLDVPAHAVAERLGHAAAENSSLVPQALAGEVSRAIPDVVYGPPAPLAAGAPGAPVSFTVHENGIASPRTSSAAATVAEALAETGVTLQDADVVTPGRESPLRAGMHVYVQYAKRVRIRLGDQEIAAYTQGGTVRDAMAAAGMELQASDTVFPGPAYPLRNGLLIAATIVRENVVQQDEAIPYETVYKYDPNLANGQRLVVQAGSNGYVRREYKVKQVNNAEVGREQVGETKVSPTNEVVAIGTASAAPAAVAAAAPAAPTAAPDGCRYMTVWSTYYTAASAGGTVTRTGTGVYKGIVAVDPRVIPLGTRMYIPGYGYALAADTGGGVKGAWVDVAYGVGETIDWYSHYVDICILP